MHISLNKFLMTGQLGELRPGVTLPQVLDLLGEPDTTGGTSRKYRRPNTYLYGTVEVYMTRVEPVVCVGVFWDAVEKGPFYLSARCVVGDWGFTPNMEQNKVETYLYENGFAFDYVPLAAGLPPHLRVSPGNVTVTFQEDALYAVSGWV